MTEQNPIIARKEAIQRRLIRYRTGKLCKHGHDSERWTLNSSCIACQSIRLKKLEPVKVAKYKRNYYLNNREKVNEYQRVYQAKWRMRNLERSKATQHRYYLRKKIELNAGS